MAYFIPSSIQKRLLRYALSRLELLDTDALDLGKLDIAWGKRSTVELRDVGLRVPKIASLLHLPDELQLVKARVLLLRVTIPADIHSSGILVEVQGVEVRAQVVQDGAGGIPSRTSGPSAGSGRSKSKKRSRSLGGGSGAHEDDELPTTKDLAKSFLEEEPAEERRELEAALSSQSGLLQESSLYGDDDEDDATVGTGTGLSLPSFLANFLKGITDRLEVTVSDVNLQLDTELSTEGQQFPCNERNAISASINFYTQSMAIEGLTPDMPRDMSESVEGPPPPRRPSRAAKRRVSLRKIGVSISADAALFIDLSKTPAPASPVDTRTSLPRGRTGGENPASSRESLISTKSSSISDSGSQLSPASAVLGEPSHLSQRSERSNHSGRALSRPEASIITDDGDRFADAGDEEGEETSVPYNSRPTTSHLVHSVISEKSDENNAYEDVLASNASLNHDLRNSTLRNDLYDVKSASTISGVLHGSGFAGDRRLEMDSRAAPQDLPLVSDQRLSATAPTLVRTALRRSQYDQAQDNRFSRSQPNPSRISRTLVDTPIGQTIEQSNVAKSDIPKAGSETERSPSSRSISSSSGKDLAQSRLFSHEEAESMYLSAMSEVSTHSTKQLDVPGGWDSTSSSSGDSASGTINDDPSTTHDAAMTMTIHDTPEVEKDCETPRPNSPSHSINRSSQSHIPHNKTNSRPSTEPGSPAGSMRSARSSIIAKQILTIDKISVWVPSGSTSSVDPLSKDHDQPEPRVLSTDDSIYQTFPGSFSHYAETSSSTMRPVPSLRRDAGRRSGILQPPKPPAGSGRLQTGEGLEALVGTVQCQLDISVARLGTQIMQQLSAVLGGAPTPAGSTPTGQEIPAEAESTHIIDVKKISCVFQETLPGISIADQFSTASVDQIGTVDQGDGLLRIDVEDVHVSSRSSGPSTNVSLSIGKFVFGFSDEAIVSFDAESRMRTSTRDLREPQEEDLSISFVRGKKSSEVNMSTLPIHISLNIQKLDETLTCFGGLSGVLELGSSIASTSTVLAASPKAQERPRGVRFDVPSDQRSSGANPQTKINARFGGMLLDLKGRSCGVSLHTSAIKAISRRNIVGMQIDEIRVSGPHFDSQPSQPPLISEISSVRITYLDSPEESDLSRLLELIMPSKDGYEDDDDILLDTLIRQRKKGSVIRATASNASININDLEGLQHLRYLSEEMAKLSTVTKYLPEDDRPGILTLAVIENLQAGAIVNDQIGPVNLSLRNFQIAHVGLPSLFALEIREVQAYRGQDEELVAEVIPLSPLDQLPMVMARMIGDEIEPTLKIKFFNLCVEYRVSTVMDLMGLTDDATAEDIAGGLASSVATITGLHSPVTLTRQSSASSDSSSAPPKPLHIDILLRDCALGLNPRNTPPKGLFFLSDTRFVGAVPSKGDFGANLEVRKAFILLIDDTAALAVSSETPPRPRSSGLGSRHVVDLCDRGYVSVSTISAAKATVKVSGSEDPASRSVEVDLKDDLFVLETCADSTQTLITILSGLAPPMPPSSKDKYRTRPIPIEHMMASFSGDAFTRPEVDDAEASLSMDLADTLDDELPLNSDFVGSIYNQEALRSSEEIGHNMLDDELGHLTSPPVTRGTGDRALSENFREQYQAAPDDEEFSFENNYFGAESEVRGTARKWDSAKNQYSLDNEFRITGSPLRVHVRDVHFIWNLFDGYDWLRTRDTIADAVNAVETKAEERRKKKRTSFDDEEDEESAIGDFLFNSIWIEIPANRDPRELHRQINRNMDDLISETESRTATVTSSSPSRQSTPRARGKKLRLERSKHHKITFELKGVSADLVVFPPGSDETQSSVDVRVNDFEIFDHVPTSTWKKFVTYMHAAGERQLGKPMIHLELLNVKPIPELAASEMVVKVTVLPLRLHVDQDALDFITRFFEFKDDKTAPPNKPEEQAFLQRVEVNTVHLKLDYKPKKVDYAGLRSGHTTEFMNFIILDGADIVLRHTIVYGVAGFDKLHKTLNDIWMPDVKRNQLPGVLAGLAPIRPLVNVGSGVRDLVVIPMQEYKKDGRVVRSIQKGAIEFAKTTTSELARLGAKLAIGTQTVLQGAEDLLSPPETTSRRSSDPEWDDASYSPSSSPSSAEGTRAVSRYADQPISVLAGLRSAARSLERDLLTARDAIVAIPGEVRESGSATGAAKAVARRAPTVILRPAIGATKAVGMTLLGAGNALDKDSRRKIDDKYKRY